MRGAAFTLAVFLRQYLVWRRLIWPSLASNVANPVLFLFAFGWGLGSFVDSVDGVSYLEFVVPGMIAYAAMFSSSFETTIGSFSRYHMQRNWDAILATPVTLGELMLGEVLWASAKALLSAFSVLLVGMLWGGVPSFTGGLLALLIAAVSAMGFASYGLVATSFARGYDFFSYFFTFWVTPMFVFSGVFFDVARFPDAVQAVAWLLPMTHLIAMIRPLSLGLALDPAAVAVHASYLVVLSVAAFFLAYRRMRKRIFD